MPSDVDDELDALGDARVPAEALAGLRGEELVSAAIALARDAVTIYDGADALDETMRPLTPGQRALLALQWCAWEVANGGFRQFVDNPTRVVAPEALAGFRRIGAAGAADALADALAVLAAADPAPDPAVDEYAAAVAGDALRGRLDPIEERFFRLLEAEVYPRAAAYVRAHPAEFVR